MSKRLIRLVGNVVSALSILFIVIAFLRIDFDWGGIRNLPVFCAICFVGLVLKVFTVFLMGMAWYRWLEFFAGRSCDHREAMRVYLKANIGKYLPGNVMHYVERNLFADKLNLTGRQMALSSLIEVCSLALTALFLGVTVSFRQLKGAVLAVTEALSNTRVGVWLADLLAGKAIVILVLAGAAVAALLAVAAVCRKCAGQASARGRVSSADHQDSMPDHGKAVSAPDCGRFGGHGRLYGARGFLSLRFGRAFLVGLLYYSIVLIVLGLILVLLYWYMAGAPSLRQGISMVSSYIIAWVLGFVIPGAPGGIGVREMALTLLLSPVVGQDRIVALSVLHRLVTVAGDFAAYLLRRAI